MMVKNRHPFFTPERLRKRCIVYVRQSTMVQVRENWGSTMLQREQQIALARSFGYPESHIDVIDEDLGRSGKSADHRTGWQEMLRRLVTGTYSAVFTTNIARLSREMGDFEELRVIAKLYDVILVVDGRPADPRDPNDTVLLHVQAALAQHDNHSRAQALSSARRAKARTGCVVYPMPIGWVKGSDGSFEFDPAVRSAIAAIYPLFWRVKSVLATTRVLREAGQLVPVRNRTTKRIEWKVPTAWRVRRFLVLRAYAGVYVYGATENRPQLGLRKDGHTKRRPAPEEKQIQLQNHHPAYVTLEEQDRIRAVLKGKRFGFRARPGRGSALGQGLLYCAKCRVRLAVEYPRPRSHRYLCQKNPTTYARVPCFNVHGPDIDEAVERLVLPRLAAPPLEELQRALAATRAGARAAAESMDAERRRLAYEEQVARDRYEQCDPRFRLVAVDAEERLEQAMQARITFEHRLATAAPAPAPGETDDELRTLCEIVHDVPALWRDPVVTDRDRKEVLACLIERILIDVRDETITGKVLWRSGATSQLSILRRAGVHRLVRELHEQGLRVPEIDRWLRRGLPATGQSWSYHRQSLHKMILRAGLHANPTPVLAEAAEILLRRMDSEGRSQQEIADELNRLGFTTAKGNAFTVGRVHWVLHRLRANDRRRESPKGD